MVTEHASLVRPACGCEGALHHGDCPAVRPERDAYVAAERKAWSAYNAAVGGPRRAFAEVLHRSRKAYRQGYRAVGGPGLGGLASGTGSWSGLLGGVASAQDAYVKAVAQTRQAYLEAVALAQGTYEQTVGGPHDAFMRALVREGAPTRAEPGSIAPWMPRAHAEAHARPSSEEDSTMKAIAIVLAALGVATMLLPPISADMFGLGMVMISFVPVAWGTPAKAAQGYLVGAVLALVGGVVSLAAGGTGGPLILFVMAGLFTFFHVFFRNLKRSLSR